MQTKTHLPSTLIFIAFALSSLFLLASVAVFGFGSVFSLINTPSDAATQMIMAFALGFVCLLLGLCAWFVLEKIRNKESADTPFSLPFLNWHILAVFGIVFTAIGIGTTASFVESPLLSWFLLPTLTIFAIVPPVWLIFGLGSNGLKLGTRWRFFSIFGISLTVAPFIMIILEVFILILGIIFAVIYLASTQPQLLQEFQIVADRLSTITNQEEILSVIAPYLANPILIALGMSYIALIVPLIEELFKPLGVWLFAKQIETPAQGFTLGLLSGAGFALFESLNASADGSMSWGVIVTARAGTSLLHMTASALMGWGIVSAFKEKKYGRLIGAYIAAVLIHGVWNAAAAGAGISAIGESIGKPEWLFNFTPALICGLLVLAIGMLAVLLASNRKLREPKVKE